MMTASGSLEPAPQMADQDSGPSSSFPSGTAKVTMGNAAMTKTMTMTIFDPLDILARTGPCLCHWTVLLPLKSLSPLDSWFMLARSRTALCASVPPPHIVYSHILLAIAIQSF